MAHVSTVFSYDFVGCSFHLMERVPQIIRIRLLLFLVLKIYFDQIYKYLSCAELSDSLPILTAYGFGRYLKIRIRFQFSRYKPQNRIIFIAFRVIDFPAFLPDFPPEFLVCHMFYGSLQQNPLKGSRFTEIKGRLACWQQFP